MMRSTRVEEGLSPSSRASFFKAHFTLFPAANVGSKSDGTVSGRRFPYVLITLGESDPDGLLAHRRWVVSTCSRPGTQCHVRAPPVTEIVIIVGVRIRVRIGIGARTRTRTISEIRTRTC